jgi:hypothetical protein
VIREELAGNPSNFIPVYLADYGDCLTLLFNGDPAQYTLCKGRMEERLDQIDESSVQSPWNLFCKANIYLHWALVSIRFGDNLKAATRFRKSYALLKENKNLYPAFQENNVLLGLEEAVAGAIPDSYKWIAAVFGVKGNINSGIGKITGYLNAHPDGKAPMYEEAMIYYAYLKFYLQQQQETAWTYINAPGFSETGNLMRCFVKANLALNYRKAAEAATVLRTATHLREYNSFPIMDYEMGEALLGRLDPGAEAYFARFLQNYKGRHFVKDAWYKIAQSAYLRQDDKKLANCLQKIRSESNTATDADKQALRFAENPVWPMRELLEVRLLIEGGNYNQALTIIQQINKTRLSTITERLEYNFRYGRVLEETGNTTNALLFYQSVVTEGRSRQEQFGARAALQMGLIYERSGQKSQAAAQFKDCLTMKKHDFQSSIDQQAKAGLNRLNY